jgi:putative addiction module killer protein
MIRLPPGNVYGTHVIAVRLYLRSDGTSPFDEWFKSLDPQTAFRIAKRIGGLEEGNVSNVKSVGDGVNEVKLDFGPGYRIYFGFEGRTVVLLLGGGTKARQDRDIAAAKERWANYKAQLNQGR